MPAPVPSAEFLRAEQTLLQALRVHPVDADVAYRLGLLYHDHGRQAEAVPYFQKVLSLRPQDADALYYLGNALGVLGRSDEALDCFRRAVAAQPRHAKALCSLGIALGQQGRLAEATTHLRQATEADPEYAPGHLNLGVSLAQQGLLEQAVISMRRALEINPNYAEVHYNLGNMLGFLGHSADSIIAYREALRHRTDYPEVLSNLGLALAMNRKPGEGAVLLRQATRLRPDFVEAHNNLGLALAELGCLEEALSCYERALTLRPRYATAHANLGSAYRGLGRLEEAVTCYEMALRYEPDSASTHWNLALALLEAGDFERGWQKYEWRWRRPGALQRPMSQPLWDGQPLKRRTILLWCEQGLGDAIQFSRYAPLVQAQGGRVILECLAPLQAVLGTLRGVDELIPEGTTRPFDCHAPLMSLPALLKTTLRTVPADVPYLQADSALVDKWRHRLEALDGLKVGIAWQGNPHHRWDHWRSVPLRAFAPLGEVPGVHLVSVQHGPGEEQRTALRGRFPVMDLGKDWGAGGPWPDIAAVMTLLDLVVTVDTATAHLAGALGKPVWVPLAALSDWRWLTERDDSPWYPTMRLFRQQKLGEWGPVFERMAATIPKMSRQNT